jgi:hypothetical protein
LLTKRPGIVRPFFVARASAAVMLGVSRCKFAAEPALFTIVTFRQQFMNNPCAKSQVEEIAHFPP